MFMHSLLLDSSIKRALVAWAGSGLLAGSLTALAGDIDVLANARAASSYASGVELARDVMDSGRDLDFDAFVMGLLDVRDGKKLALTDEQITRIVRSVEGNQLRSNVIKRASAKKGPAREGELFQEKFAKQPGVVVLPSGLQYNVIKQGQGAIPKESSNVELRYVAKLVDGSRVDATPEGKTSIFKVDALMPGLKEALLLMSVGSNWQVVVPGPLAYGNRRVGRIGPDETLVFELELVSIP